MKCTYTVEPFPESIELPLVVIPGGDVDTDRIIPAEFLKGVTKSGLGPFLFVNERHKGSGLSLDSDLSTVQRVQDHPLNVFEDTYGMTPQVILTPSNFGCGSSREHAPWSLNEYGIRVIVSGEQRADGGKQETKPFSPIFQGSCYENGILPVAIPYEEVQSLIERLQKREDTDPPTLVINLKEQMIKIPVLGWHETFEIGAQQKRQLLEGLDSADRILKDSEQAIRAYQQRLAREKPWRVAV